MCFNPSAVFNDNQVPKVRSAGAFSDLLCSSAQYLIPWPLSNQQSQPLASRIEYRYFEESTFTNQCLIQKPMLNILHLPHRASIMIEVSASDLVPSGRSCRS